MTSAVPLSPRAVLPWRESLLGLAERLERPDPGQPVRRRPGMVFAGLTVAPARLLISAPAATSMSDAVWWRTDGLALHADADPAAAEI